MLTALGLHGDEKRSPLSNLLCVPLRVTGRTRERYCMKIIPHHFSAVGLWANTFHRGSRGFKCNGCILLMCSHRVHVAFSISVPFFELSLNSCKHLLFHELKSTHFTLFKCEETHRISCFPFLLEAIKLIDYGGKESLFQGFRPFSMSGIGNLLPWWGPSFMAINFVRLGT